NEADPFADFALAPRREAGKLLVEHADAAGLNGAQRADQRHQRGFAGARRAGENDDLAGVHVHVDVDQRRRAFARERKRHAADLDRAIGHDRRYHGRAAVERAHDPAAFPPVVALLWANDDLDFHADEPIGGVVLVEPDHDVAELRTAADQRADALDAPGREMREGRVLHRDLHPDLHLEDIALIDLGMDIHRGQVAELHHGVATGAITHAFL